MKPFWLLVLVLVSFNPVSSQEVRHAPTVKQCRADQRLWLAKLKDGSIEKLPETYSTVAQWIPEMLNCEDVDPKNRLPYYNVVVQAYVDLLMRTTNFIIRHGLWEQFAADDTQGKR